MTARPIIKTDPQLEAAYKQFDKLVEHAPHLAEIVAFYRALLPILRQAQTDVSVFTLEPEIAQQKLSAGVPLLVDEDLPLELEALRALLLKLCRIAQGDGPANASTPGNTFFRQGQRTALAPVDQTYRGSRGASLATKAASIEQAIEQGKIDIFAVVSALAAGQWQHIGLMVIELALDMDLLRTLAQNALKPWLRAWRQTLDNLVPLDHWRRGQCPFCGSSPVLADIRSKEGACFLRCAMCGAAWPYPRLQCAGCANHDHKSLSILYVEGEQEKYRVQVCKRCRSYLKMVVTFELTPVEQLVVEDLATLHLDLIAAEHKFTRVSIH